jgi:hypothetical protein
VQKGGWRFHEDRESISVCLVNAHDFLKEITIMNYLYRLRSHSPFRCDAAHPLSRPPLARPFAHLGRHYAIPRLWPCRFWRWVLRPPSRVSSRPSSLERPRVRRRGAVGLARGGRGG